MCFKSHGPLLFCHRPFHTKNKTQYRWSALAPFCVENRSEAGESSKTCQLGLHGIIVNLEYVLQLTSCNSMQTRLFLCHTFLPYGRIHGDAL